MRHRATAPGAPLPAEIDVVPFENTIPRLIHQTFRTKAVPHQIEANIAYLKTQNPAYTHILYDDKDIEEFILNDYGAQVFSQYKRIAPEYGAARADIFRYLLMYKVGGLYLDIKSTSTRPLDEALRPDDRFLISQWTRTGPGELFEGWGKNEECAHVPGGEFQQWFIWCAPGHPFLHAVIKAVLRNIETYKPWRDGTGRDGTLRNFGPRVYTKTIFPLMKLYPHRLVRCESEIGLNYSLYGDIETHAALSPTYYRYNKSPIVLQSLARNLLFQAYWLARKLPVGKRLALIAKNWKNRG